MKNNKGISLIELLIVITIMGIVIQVLFSIYFVGNKSYALTEDKGFAQKDIRVAADFITKELRTAREISKDSFGSNRHYAFLLKDDGGIVYLFRESYNPSASRKICKIENLKFSAVLSGEMLNVNVTTTEKNQSFDLIFDINLENIDSVTIPDNTSIIYYTKY